MKRICVLLVMIGLAVEVSGQTVTGSGAKGSVRVGTRRTR
jgi:hypothetical protein